MYDFIHVYFNVYHLNKKFIISFFIFLFLRPLFSHTFCSVRYSTVIHYPSTPEQSKNVHKLGQMLIFIYLKFLFFFVGCLEFVHTLFSVVCQKVL